MGNIPLPRTYNLNIRTQQCLEQPSQARYAIGNPNNPYSLEKVEEIIMAYAFLKSITPHKNYNCHQVRTMLGLSENTHFGKDKYPYLVSQGRKIGYSGESIVKTLENQKMVYAGIKSRRSDGRFEVKVF